jgi:hypothetical protein
MKDDVKIKVPNGNPRTPIFLDGVVNRNVVLKFDARLENDHATHFKSWMERPIKRNLG